MTGMIYFLVILLTFSGISYEKQTEDFEVGCNLFEDVIKSKAFVDKSNLIKDFFNYRWTLITAPRRFGKSINMNMLKTFFEISVDDFGNRMTINETNNYKIFMNNKLQICEDRVFFNKHFGSYPVIFLDFKKLNCSDYSSFIRSFNRLVRETFISHKYLLSSSNLDEEAKCDFNKSYEGCEIETLDDNELRHSILTLSRILFTHFNYTKSIILIDEFDFPFQRFIRYGGQSFEIISSFIIEFIFITLKSNFYVGRSLINTCIRPGTLIGEENSIQIMPFLRQTGFSKYYGLTEKEVQGLLKKCNISENINNVRRWYNGYTVQYIKVNIYNTFSILKYLGTKTLQHNMPVGNYNLQILFTYDEISRKIEDLLNNFQDHLTEGVEIKYHQVITINQIRTLNNIIMRTDINTTDDADLLLQYLTENGYFVILEEKGDRANISIPNKELYDEIETQISTNEFFIRKFKTAFEEFSLIPKLFYKIIDNTYTFTDIVECIGKLYYDSEFPKCEQELQRDVFLSFKISQIFFEVEGKNDGRGLEILLKSKDKRTAIIVKLKLYWKTAYEALQEIIDGNHHSLQDSEGRIKTKIYIGLHLSKNYQCRMSYLINSIDIKNAINLTSKARKRKKKESSWTWERTKRHGEIMKEYWKQKKHRDY